MKQSKLAGFMPEMRIFWFFILLVLGVMGTTFFELRPVLKIVSTVILAGIGFIVYVTTRQIGAKNLETQTAVARLTHVISAMSDGVFVYDQQFKIYIVNPVAEQILGLNAKDIIGQTFTLKLKEGMASKYRILLTLLFPALAPSVIRRSEGSGYPQIADFSFLDPETELRVTTNEVRDEEGYLVGYIKVISDRTREVALLKAKSEFITLVSHQLRTPLTAVAWAWEAFKNEPLTEAQADLVQTGTSATKNLLKIVEDLLQTSQIEQGKFGYTFSNIDLVILLKKIVQDNEIFVKNQGVSLVFETSEKELIVPVDETKLVIALMNLLENAVHYNVPGGEVRFRLARFPNKPYAEIRIEDTGMGMTEDTMKKLFGKFFRGEESKKIQANGSGLGLYIVKNIIARHGGTITAESTLNRGSIFHIILPTESSLIPAKERIYGEE